jgi:hypothetical protein
MAGAGGCADTASSISAFLTALDHCHLAACAKAEGDDAGAVPLLALVLFARSADDRVWRRLYQRDRLRPCQAAEQAAAAPAQSCRVHYHLYRRSVTCELNWRVGQPSVAKLLGHRDSVSAARTLGSDNATIASASWDQSIRVWRRERDGAWECTACRQNAHSAPVWGLAAMGDDALVSACSLGELRIWDVSSLQGERVAACGPPLALLRGHTDRILGVYAGDAAAGDSRGDGLVLSASRDKTVRVWDPRQPGAAVRVLFGGDATACAYSVARFGNVLVAGLHESLSCVDIRTWRAEWRLARLSDSPVMAVAVDEAGVVAGDKGGMLRCIVRRPSGGAGTCDRSGGGGGGSAAGPPSSRYGISSSTAVGWTPVHPVGDGGYLWPGCHARGVRAVHLAGTRMVTSGNDGDVKFAPRPGQPRAARRLPGWTDATGRSFKLSKSRAAPRRTTQVVDVDCTEEQLVCASMDGTITVADFGIGACPLDEGVQECMRALSLAGSADERAACKSSMDAAPSLRTLL